MKFFLVAIVSSFSLLATLICYTQNVVPPDGSSSGKPIAISATVAGGSVAYQIDGQPVTQDLLRSLELIVEKRGKDVRVTVTIDSRLPFTVIGNLEGTLGKAQITQVRFYVVNIQSGLMSSVNLGKAIPYSNSPAWD